MRMEGRASATDGGGRWARAEPRGSRAPAAPAHVHRHIHTYIYIRISTVDSATVLLEAGLFLARQTGC